MKAACLGGAFLLLSGCAQILGLDNTTFDAPAVDVPSVCDGAPACISTNGRSVCGQLFGTGPTANLPLRVAAFTGAVCQGGNVEGPCGLTVAAYPKATYFDGSRTGKVAGQIDDCGRFAVGDIETSVADVAIELTGTGFQPTATLLINRTTIAGEDRDIKLYAVASDTLTLWANQMSSTTPPDTTTGYLIDYTTIAGPLVGEAVALDMGSAFGNPPGTVPWAGYFATDSVFGNLDMTLMSTGNTGTAFAVLPPGTFSLEGFRTGKRCKVTGLQQVPNTLIHITEVDC